MTRIKFKPGFNHYIPATFNRLVDELVRDKQETNGEERHLYPEADVVEYDDKYQLVLELPGVAKTDLEINVDKDLLKVTGKKLVNVRNEQNKLWHSEISQGTFKRSFRLPENILDEKISAELENGILVINIPKDQTKPIKRVIDVK